MAQHKVVLCIQDTTELDYNGQAITGLGPLSYEAQRGLYLHPTYIVSPEREPLGVFNAWTWARQFKGKDGKRPGLCESTRWIESYERIADSAQQLELPPFRGHFPTERKSPTCQDLNHPTRKPFATKWSNWCAAAALQVHCPRSLAATPPVS